MLKGVYVLLIELSNGTSITVGALGKIAFEKGLYAYAGSAQRNLEQRIERHFRRDKRLFWHIDYLLCSDQAKVLQVFYKKAGKTEECTIVSAIETIGESVYRFGCSDCRCKSHLFNVNNQIDVLRERLTKDCFNIFSRPNYRHSSLSPCGRDRLDLRVAS